MSEKMNKLLHRIFLASVLLLSFPSLSLQAQEEGDQDMIMDHMPMKDQGMKRSGSEEAKDDMMGQGMMGQGMMGQGMMGQGMMGRDMMGGCPMMGGSMGMGMMGYGKGKNSKALTEGQLAYMKAELEITEAQKAAWEDYATAVRTRSTTLRDMRSTFKHGMRSGTALERIETRIKFMEARVEALKAVKAPLEVLYTAFNETQKKKADNLFGKGPCPM